MGRPRICVDNLTRNLAHLLERQDLSITTDQAAALLGLSPSTFTRSLKAEGTTLYRMKQAERVRRLREAIEDAPGSTPSFLAELCGISEPRTFERFFISVIGCAYNAHRDSAGLPPISIQRDINEGQLNEHKHAAKNNQPHPKARFRKAAAAPENRTGR